ncbi:hypothetical protein CHLNCDRAFT_143015 [Chlorella variabilis]|uniref:E3 UFM1-protein ligase 1 homolog n=1 Tax=Chlorella variabilis TaxID=554065 RepID=E1Z9A9_CHLVA|nr:hypothetical protein CHLNCDRAFT_143015 [Chlorella variabilis]EFN57486.1 hypothetical protein CHLNCDRAFT_143015 [Chlorella variabilis]|eukprot:XP_005849588.1 hypothetical protein CHLNCDRAFT_143015 [Chlorella variabilis]
MELSLDDLLSGLQEAQQKKSKARLSERNVVELVNKLKQLGLLGDDLLYTSNGKEYVTRERVAAEVRAAVRAAGGRIPLVRRSLEAQQAGERACLPREACVDLPSQLGLDLVHCERAADAVVAASSGGIQLAQGELFSSAYFDGLAAEVDEGLQEAGVVSVGDLARRFGLGAEMIGGVLGERVGTRIHGRMDAGVIYTQAYLTRIKAQLRGALRGAVSPVSIPALVRELGIEGLASLKALVPSLVDELAAEGSVAGKLAPGASSWVPATYVQSQQDAVTRFFQQNGHIAYDTVRQYGIPAPRPFLAHHFPDGLALDSAYLSPAVVEAAAEEALAAGGWCDVAPHLPSILSPGDTAALLAQCRAVAGAAAATGGRAHVMAGSCVVAAALLESIRAQLLEAARQAADDAHRRQKKGGEEGGGGGGAAGRGKVTVTVLPEGGGKKAAAAAAAADSGSDNGWDVGGKKGKKGGRGKKGKAAAGGSGGGKPARSGGGGGGKAAAGQGASAGGGGGGGGGGPSSGALSLDSLARRVAQMHPDTEGAGADGDLPRAIAAGKPPPLGAPLWLRPAIVAEYERALHAIFTAGAERRRRLRDAAVAALDAAHERLLLYAHGAELFADDEAAVPRAAIIKRLQPDVKPAVSAAVDKLTGSSLEQFQSELDAAAEAAGLRLRRLDKRTERTLVFAQRKLWESQAAAAPDASTLLMLVVPLLLARQHGRAVSLPGRAVSAALDLLQGGQLPQDSLQLLADFHAAVVDQLKLQSGGRDEEARDEATQKLERLMPHVWELAAAGGGGAGGEAGGEA